MDRTLGTRIGWMNRSQGPPRGRGAKASVADTVPVRKRKLPELWKRRQARRAAAMADAEQVD